ncbi:crossover junction endonuclease EME1B-like [Tripterygium wilfordii]|uniref:Crossover junction endonuclease EME1B-like n=1 Tax=Tripterygium wilfordii TaxID=458696 RepID=A0A7J7DFN4_TRIWF|nr:crossover junction endonuclease EME1B isoform X2 [Tripterygium wilfordii]KAF5745180.1 crossover junction endonuclease EME1B-like [Tripterygium wilfordii]
MSDPIILSDGEEGQSTPSTPCAFSSKKPRTEPDPIPTVFVVDDDPTPQKPGLNSSTPSFVAETPMSDVSIVKCTTVSFDPQIRVKDSYPKLSSSPYFVVDSPMSDVSSVKCTRVSSDPQARVSISGQKYTGTDGLICLESDNESESASAKEKWIENGLLGSEVDNNGESGLLGSYGASNLSQMSDHSSAQPAFSPEQVHGYSGKENLSAEEMMGNIVKQKRKTEGNAEKNRTREPLGNKRMTKEERICLMKEKKFKKEQEKLHKAALKAEAAELKKVEKEKQKWGKGKFALKSIVAEIDTKILELGSVGGYLLTRLAEKGITFRVTSNPIERSIVWTMNAPEHITQLCPKGIEIPYVLLAYEADEFCNLIASESLLDHVAGVQNHYPSYTVCYLTNRLMAYINKREKENYKNPANDHGWRRPPVEEVLAKLTTQFARVHSRQCTDEAELAEHIVGLTCSLASCQFRKKLTCLSVSANGSLIPKDATDRNLIKKSLWLKALIAIPKVQPRFAIAIWKKYPTMKSLLSVYMDPSISEHDKEFMLKDLMTEGLLGGDRRLGEVCSKRVYRILMARSGSIKTDDVEDGADFFSHQSL